MSTQAQIQAIIDTYRQAVMTKDVEKVMTLYADDILSFDAIKALQFKGKEAYRAHWIACMEMCPGPHIFEFHEIAIETGENIAFAHWVANCGGINDKGETQSCWMRATACYRLVGGTWKIAHEHWSAPFDPMTGSTLFDAKP
ncbi:MULTISPECIES: YybH family protein [unclassified Pseudomonas]|uniref:YybH family protein n=1 Tax=unclassified Pseudomonas TaxID=196821 RepID=UPI00200C3780|nr:MULTISPECIES: nuclear transport factor 2 family protein [unclassified Pseudomonas]